MNVAFGVDTNANGELDGDEITRTEAICNGADGADGMNGADGADGMNGADGTNGTDGTDGTDGADGVDGMNGADGVDGMNGADGTDGTDGRNSVFRQSTEAAGNNCANGGMKIEVGFDANANGNLDDDEVSATNYICNGESGADGVGQNGQNSLIVTSEEPAGENCAAGGVRFDVGLDANGDGTLDAAEVTSSSYVCNETSSDQGDDDDTTTDTSASTYRDIATIVGLDVTSADGKALDEYYVGHALKVTTELEPNNATPAEVAAMHNMHIGLVRELKANQTAADGHTCYLGSLGGSSFQVTSAGNVLFDGVFAIPERCLVNDDPATFNVWISINPRVLMKLTKTRARRKPR